MILLSFAFQIPTQFTISWKSLKFYPFLPFSVILRALQNSDKATGIVVVSLWTTQPWFPLFSSLSQKPIVFKPKANLLLSSARTVHQLSNVLTLVVVTYLMRIPEKPNTISFSSNTISLYHRRHVEAVQHRNQTLVVILH